MPKRLPGPSVLALIANPPLGPDLWRCLQPATALQRAGYPVDWTFIGEQTLRYGIDQYDVFLTPRMTWRSRRVGEAWFRDAKAAGKVVILDLDDAVLGPEETERRIALDWTDGKSIEQLETERADRAWTLQQADGCTVSTEALAAHVRQYTGRRVEVVANAIDLRFFRSVLARSRRTVPGLTIGWAGGRRPDADVEQMAQAWGRIARRYPDVTFVVQGWQPAVIAEHVPEARICRLPWLPLQDYPAGLVNIDIGCASVEAGNAFAACKSVIKVWEMAVAGAAVVASHALYDQAISDGHDGLLASSSDEWEDALARLVEDPWLRQRLQRRQLKRVERDHALEKNLHRWSESWQRIVASARLVGRTA